MNVIERMIYSSNNNHVGSIFTYFDQRRVEKDEKQIIEKLIADYVKENIYPDQIGNVYTELEQDLASLTVYFDLNTIETVEHNFNFPDE